MLNGFNCPDFGDTGIADTAFADRLTFIAGLASVTLTIPFAPSPAVILLAVGFSAPIGMVFGFFPALRGARLDPIDALRHE